LPDFDPQKVLFGWSENDPDGFTIADATAGVCVFGATGSGKTSGPGRTLAHAYLKNGFGGLVLCAKPEERQQWETWARETKRSADLIVVDADGYARFNFLEWAANQGGQGAGYTINIVSLLDEIAGAVDEGAGEGEGGGDSAFFRAAHRHMLMNVVDLAQLARLRVELPLLREIVSSAPLSLAQKNDPQWQEQSACWRALREAEAATENDPARRADFRETRAYWEQDFPTLSDRTRSIIVLMFSMLVRPFITRPLRQLFAEDTTITPEATNSGKIIIVDLPVQTYRLAGRVAALAWKWCFQLSVMRRVINNGPRPVFLYCDESQNFCTEHDAEYQAVARSAGGCTVYLTQQRESLRRVLKSDDAVENLLANLQAKFFCQNTGATNYWAAGLLGERFVKVTSTNTGRTAQQREMGESVGGSAGVSRSDQRRYYVEPAAFTTLRRGGPANEYWVEAIVYAGGKLFPGPNREQLPYKLLTFRQR
jgi:TraM recognition site of TraD and TraG